MNRLFDAVLNRPALMAPALLIARLFMSAVFVTFGISKAVFTPQIQEYMRAHNVSPGLVYLVIVVQIGFGLMVAVGYQTRLAALMLAGFCMVATSLFHTAWHEPGELAHFTKDFSIAGGFLFMIAYVPGAWSLDAYLSRARTAGRSL